MVPFLALIKTAPSDHFNHEAKVQNLAIQIDTEETRLQPVDSDVECSLGHDRFSDRLPIVHEGQNCSILVISYPPVT